jgi:hypothetical protein
MKPAGQQTQRASDPYGFDVSDESIEGRKGVSDDQRLLENGLESALRSPGFTTIAFQAPVVAAATVVAAWRSAPLVAWSSREMTIVGVGVAHELRGSGDARWDEIVAGSRQLAIDETMIGADQIGRAHV